MPRRTRQRQAYVDTAAVVTGVGWGWQRGIHACVCVPCCMDGTGVLLMHIRGLRQLMSFRVNRARWGPSSTQLTSTVRGGGMDADSSAEKHTRIQCRFLIRETKIPRH